jgi:hypothetical protein
MLRINSVTENPIQNMHKISRVKAPFEMTEIKRIYAPSSLGGMVGP